MNSFNNSLTDFIVILESQLTWRALWSGAQGARVMWLAINSAASLL
jgi:hypothetical protein